MTAKLPCGSQRDAFRREDVKLFARPTGHVRRKHHHTLSVEKACLQRESPETTDRCFWQFCRSRILYLNPYTNEETILASKEFATGRTGQPMAHPRDATSRTSRRSANRSSKDKLSATNERADVYDQDTSQRRR